MIVVIISCTPEFFPRVYALAEIFHRVMQKAFLLYIKLCIFTLNNFFAVKSTMHSTCVSLTLPSPISGSIRAERGGGVFYPVY